MQGKAGSEPNGATWPVYVLAGGQSARFGRDKAREPRGDTTLIQSVARTLRPISRVLAVVADRAGRYEDLGFSTIADREPGLGPIGGLSTALAHCEATVPGAEYLLLVACDWKGISATFVRELAARCERGADFVVFRGEKVEPLFGLYAVGAGATVDRAIGSGIRAMHVLLERLSGVYVPVPSGWQNVRNVNRPADLN